MPILNDSVLMVFFRTSQGYMGSAQSQPSMQSAEPQQYRLSLRLALQVCLMRGRQRIRGGVRALLPMPLLMPRCVLAARVGRRQLAVAAAPPSALAAHV